MAKALKIVAIGLAVGALAIATGGAAVGLGLSLSTSVLGVSASALLIASTALEVGAGLLQKKSATTSSQTDRLTTSLDPRTPRKTVLGKTAMANDLRYEEWFGADQEYCGWIIALASHKIESLDEIWINQEQVWAATGGTVAKYQGYFYVQKVVTEGSPSNTTVVSSPDAGKWNTSSRLTGCAYVHIQFRVTGVNSKATSPFSSLPSRLTLIGRGGMLFDPRRDSTVPGGSGPMRAGDQSTWRFTTDDGAEIGNNLPLQILRVLLGWKITNPSTGAQKLAVGCGLPARRIDMGSFITGANIADELANVSAGGTEPKFHGAAVLSEGDDPHAHLDMLLAACNGRLREVNGKLALAIMHNDLAGAAADDGLNDDDVIGAFTWESDPPLDQCVNVIRGKFTDPSTTSLYQQIDYPEVRLDSPDGIDRVMTLDLSVVESASHAQRVAKQVLERRQYQRTFSAPFDIRAWKYRLGDPVPLTLSALSFDRRVMRVSTQELGQDGQCVMSLVDENPAIYAWDADDAPPVTAAEPVIYDPTKSPLILAIGEAADTASWPRITDPDGTRPDDNATVGAPAGTTVGGGTVTVARVWDDTATWSDTGLWEDESTIASGGMPAEEVIANIAELLGASGELQTAVDATTALVGKIDLTVASDTARRQLDNDLSKLSEAVAQLLAGQSVVQNVFRDAGLYTDPASGVAKLFAIDQQADRLSQVAVTLNAALGTIGLKASVDYVNEAILTAELGGSTADLAPLLVRLTSAEADIDGLQATVLLKADATVVTGIQGVVSSVQTSLEALTATVETKASQTIVDAQGARLTLAEQTLTALDGASISQAVTASRFAPAASDITAQGNILALLGSDDAKQGALFGIAQARTDLVAHTDALGASLASQITQLAVATGTSLASLSSTLVVQSSVTSALSGTLTALSTTVGSHTTTLTTYGTSIDGLRGKWGVEFNSDGVVSGFALNNGSGRTDAVFVVSTFKIAQPDGTGARVVFNITAEGVVQMHDVEVDRLKVNTAVVPKFSSMGSTVTGSGVPTGGAGGGGGDGSDPLDNWPYSKSGA